MITNLQAKSIMQAIGPFGYSDQASLSTKGSDFVKQDGSEILQKVGVELVNKVGLLDRELKNIAAALIKLVSHFTKSSVPRQAYIQEEQRIEGAQAPVATRPSIAASSERSSDQSFTTMLRSLLTNPVVLAGIAGIVYTMLPEDTKEKVRTWFGTFKGKLEDHFGQLSDLSTQVKIVGGLLALHLGASLFRSVAEATATLITLSTKLGQLITWGRGPRALQTLLGGALIVGGGVLAKKKIEEYVGGGLPETEGGEISSGEGKVSLPPEPAPAPASSAFSDESGNVPYTPRVAGRGEDESGNVPYVPTAPSMRGGGDESGVVPYVPRPQERKPVVEIKPPFPGSKPIQDKTTRNIKKHVRLINSTVDIDNLNPSVKERLAGMAEEYYLQTGRKLQINSGYRSTEKQTELYEKLGHGKVAMPGKSQHEKGMAFDIQSNDADRLDKMGLLRKYGFHRPLANLPAGKKETWHIEAVEARGGSLPDNPPSTIPTKGTAADFQRTDKDVTPTTMQPSSSLEPTTQNLGQNLNELSTSIEAAYTGGDVNIASIDNSRTREIGKPDVGDVPPVPSPIADRGSLSNRVYHSTAYG